MRTFGTLCLQEQTVDASFVSRQLKSILHAIAKEMGEIEQIVVSEICCLHYPPSLLLPLHIVSFFVLFHFYL